MTVKLITNLAGPRWEYYWCNFCEEELITVEEHEQRIEEDNPEVEQMFCTECGRDPTVRRRSVLLIQK